MGSEQLRLTESLLRRVIEGTEAELRVKECAAQEDELEEYVMECACDVSRLGDGHVKGDMSPAYNFQEELEMKNRGLIGRGTRKRGQETSWWHGDRRWTVRSRYVTER